MRDIQILEIADKERVRPCCKCNLMPVIFSKSSAPSVEIQCPECKRHSNRYSAGSGIHWSGYDYVKMAVVDWNKKNQPASI